MTLHRQNSRALQACDGRGVGSGEEDEVAVSVNEISRTIEHKGDHS